MKVIHAADLFCGAGGTSTGLARACESLGMGLSLIAVNHWDIAIRTHTANHPTAQHLCTSLDSVDPRKVVPAGHLHLLVASPECTHHSIARGGKPVTDQSRSTAWHVLRWAEALRIDSILIENVREFRDWGPIGTNGRPLKTKRGDTYRAFLNSLRSLGYVVEDRILNAANYGDPTTRERLFIIARRGRRKITWPDASHAADGRLPMGLEKWKAAREIIDWSLVGQSIFNRKRPLAPATLARIEAGLRKFGGANAEPFIVVLRRRVDGRSIDRPLPTVTAGGQHMRLCEPFISKYYGTGSVKPVSEPLDTITAKDRFALVTVDGQEHELDIHFRMLQPHELSRAMSFADDYIFEGTREQRVKQIGNAVPVQTAMALCRELIA